MSAASPKSPQAGASVSVVTPAMTDPNSTQLYINNLSFSTTPDALTDFFSKALSAPPAEVSIISHKYSGRSKGFGFVRVSKADAAAALALNGQQLDGRELGIAEAVEKSEEEKTAQRERRDAKRTEQRAQKRQERDGAQGQQTGGRAGGDQSAGGAGLTSSSNSLPRPRAPRMVRVVPDGHAQLYVSNLSYATSDAQLKALVEEAIGGEAGVEVDIIKRKGGLSDGRSRGYGFVTVPNDKLDKALTLNGREVDERALGVVIAKERPAQDAAGTAGGDAESGQAAAPAPRRRPRSNRRRGPRANGDGTPDTLEAAPAGTGSIYADGSSAPTPAGKENPNNGDASAKHRAHKSTRKPRGGSGAQQSGAVSEVAATQQ